MVEEGTVKASIVKCVIGIVGFGEENQLVDVVLFPKNPREIAERQVKTEAGFVIDEVAKLVKNLQKKGYKVFLFENPTIAKNAHESLGIDVDTVSPSEAGEILRGKVDKFAVDVGFVRQSEEFHEWVHKVSMELTKIKIKEAAEKRDLVVSQAIQTIDDLDKTLNLYVSRLREWYGLHFPELSRLVDKNETYAHLVANLGRRENFTSENLKKEGLPINKINKTAKAAKVSIGAEFNDADIDQLRKMCESSLALYDVRRSLESYVDSTMDEIAPNLRALAGPLLGARLISHAGGLNNLAKMPASTVQVIGAEKALFRALRSGARPPKHGIIFQHPFLREVRQRQRGKLARALAGKLAIAARVDAFGSRYVGDQLKGDLEKRIEEIKKQAPRSMRRG